MITSSIHTLQLQAQISPDEYRRLYIMHSDLHLSVTHKTTVNRQHPECTNEIYTCRQLPYYGINSITTLKNKRILPNDNNIIKYYIYIDINPYNALHNQKHSGADIIAPGEIQSAMNISMRYLNTLLSPQAINALSLKRLDFCLNLIFPNQIQADEYLKLLKKGVPGKVLSEKKHPDPIQHRLVPYKNALLLECKSYSFEIYPKYHQMTARKMHNADNASGMVRFELRASKTKIAQLANKYEFPCKKGAYMDFLTNAPDISEQEIPYIVAKMVGNGNFYSYEHVMSKIENADLKDSEKRIMVQTVKHFSRHTLQQNLLNELNITHQDWKRILKKFDKIKCSPIPVPGSYQYHTYPGIAAWKSVF